MTQEELTKRMNEAARAAHEFGKMVQMATVRINYFDKVASQPYKDHAFMEKLRLKFSDLSNCVDLQDASMETLADFGVEEGTIDSCILRIFEQYFKTK